MIMNALISFQDQGMHHSQIAESIGIDRKTLRPYMKLLMGMHLVTREPGRHGKYFPTTKRHRGTSISADILAESFKQRFLGYNTFVLDSPYFKRRIPNDDVKLENALFNFSNIVGGWITYILIQSMNPVNKLTNHTKDVTEKNIIVQTWIEDAISLIQPDLLFSFNYYISHCLKTLHKRISNLKGGFSDSKNINKVLFDFTINRRLLVVDDEIASELNGAFSNLYPNLNRELEKTRAELPILVKREIDGMNRYDEIIRRQKMCKPHEFILEDDYGEYRVFKCKKCGKKERREII